METYIALLRGINVSGQKKIKMADLRLHLEELNFQNILTHYGFEVSVLIKTPEDLENTIKNNPFLQDSAKDPKYFYVTFLAKAPSLDGIEKLKEKDYSPEEYDLMDELIYVYPPQGYGRAKMNNNFFEKKLKVAATTRNWRTIHKLLEMAT